MRKPVIKKESSGSGFGLSQALELANTSVEAFNSYTNLQIEKEVTKRVQIEGQKDVILGEKELEKVCMEHSVRLVELDNSDKDSLRSHEQVMKKLDMDKFELYKKKSQQDRVLNMLEKNEITPEQAVLLMYKYQE